MGLVIGMMIRGIVWTIYLSVMLLVLLFGLLFRLFTPMSLRRGRSYLHPIHRAERDIRRSLYGR